MEQFFASLSKRQTMLLLTSLAFGGSEAVDAYQHLNVEEEELLKHRAFALLKIPREKRVPLLVQEIKRLVTQRRRQLAGADPRKLAELLRKERPALVEVVLRALSSDLADSVRSLLIGHQKVKLAREVRPDILSIIRWKLEDELKQRSPQVGVFRFTDLMTLQQREVLAVCDRMGARVLATAVAGLPDDERGAFLQALPPDQRTLATRAAEAGKVKRLSPDDAKTVLEMHGALESPSQGLRSAGVQRLARASLAQSPEFAQRLAERHPGDLGRLLARWVREERHRAIKGDGGRMDIVEQMERLAQKGIVDRPMRLPPPSLGGGPPAQPRPSGAPAAPATAAGAEPRRRTSQVAQPTQAPPARRDPIAERKARQAGAAPRVPQVLRDGKPLVREPTASGPRPQKPAASPALQERPRRKDRDAPGPSPVVKGPGRGPTNGSR